MNAKEVTIIDYGVGNLFSIEQAIIYAGGNPVISSDSELILNSNHLILPGVGAFGNAMDHLENIGLIDPIREYAASGRPLMGVCLGMQLLFQESEEFGLRKGLGIIEGNIKKFPSIIPNHGRVKIPQICWNQIYETNNENWLDSPLRNVENGSFMYFVHSYYANPKDDANVLSNTEYAGISYCSSVKKDNIFGFQFHPEKSTKQGLSIYRDFINI